jgi:signal transduction histidine kinase
MTTNGSATVLNVDDEEAPRYVKTRDLKRSGFAVLEAASGAEALLLIEKEKPPIVLLDVQLPDMKGTEVCALVKSRWPEVMVLMTSATFTTAEHRTFGLDSGADSYLLQPADRLELAAAINSLLRIRRVEDDLRALNATLEKRVDERTSELMHTNARLREEIAQRKKAEKALVQAQKMEAVGQLTGGLAHDFNNLLTAVIGNLELIKARVGDARIARLAEHGLTAASRGAKLTSQLLAFSRTQKLAATAVDVNALIDGMYPILNQTLGPNIEVRQELDGNLPAATADANQLELAILNLCINARDAMPEGGSITLRSFLDPQDQGFVIVSVADTGCGMTPETMSRAFDPFFTTKPAGKGTGLGLSQVFGIVHQLGGDVSIESEVGKGTDIRISLPRSEMKPQTTPGPRETVALQHSERVLIVDDDDDVREVLTGILSEIGYVVKGLPAASDALEVLEEFKPDLIIVDFAMPGRNGAEFAQIARQRLGNVPTLFVSGYADDDILQSLGDGAPILRKPFHPVELAATVRSTLEGGVRKRPF